MRRSCFWERIKLQSNGTLCACQMCTHCHTEHTHTYNPCVCVDILGNEYASLAWHVLAMGLATGIRIQYEQLRPGKQAASSSCLPCGVLNYSSVRLPHEILLYATLRTPNQVSASQTKLAAPAIRLCCLQLLCFELEPTAATTTSCT